MSDNVRIKRVKVSHYGPLTDVDIDLDSGFNAFYGRNESGKTLLVESITKMLVDDSSDFDGIGRVSQQPNGLLTIENGGEEFDASQEGLEKIFGDVSPEDVKNAFIVRDFDLRLPERENDFGNGDYFNDVTDRVLGSKTKKIEALRDEIAEVGYLTNTSSDAKLENTKGTGKLRDKRDRAEDMKNDIQSFMNRIEDEGLFQKYSKIDSLKNEISARKEAIEELKNAREQRKYRKGQRLLEDLKEAERRKEDLENEKKALEDLETIRRGAEGFEAEASEKNILKYASIGSGFLSGVSLVGALLNPVPVLVGGAVVFLAAAGYTLNEYRKASRKVKIQENERENIIEEARARGVEASTIPEVVDAIDSYENDLDKREKKINRERNSAVGELKGLFDANRDDPREWKQVLDDFSESFRSVDREFSEEDLQHERDELKRLKDEKEGLESEIDRYGENLREFDSGVSEVLEEKFMDESIVSVDSVEDLDRALRQLEEFVSSLNVMVEASKNAIKILEEMEAEEEDEFNRIFRDDSYAVEMFREATDGNYTDINYDKASRKLKVERKDGRELDPQDLSQGTYDLLYMAVRLKLAKEILGKPGFLILDNAFVHSDTERIRKEIDFLKELEKEGWQIIYFTFRDDVREILEEETEVKELKGLDF
ncbi:ATP-binding protein [Candidatus Nanosalina sp. VS9-1]|uniref:ATP-binding protein n=1 Tax=Candidatus Nanosalina sp. VS9-1 TaxID=3388566 RepID=UPI0039E1C02B